MLAACGTAPEAAPPPKPPPAAAAEAVPQPEKAAEIPAPQWVARPEPKPEKSYPPPSALDGLGAGAVTALLGRPRLKRRDEPAELWQYRTRACALDLFLYRDGDGGPFRVRHFEARPRGGGEVTVEDCFTSLLKAQEKRQAG